MDWKRVRYSHGNLAAALFSTWMIACGGGGTAEDGGVVDAAAPDASMADAGARDSAIPVDAGDSCDGVDCSGLDDECNEGVCVDGVCEAQPLPADTACGDPTDDECTDPDTCDGAGACVANHEASGAACGDTGVECLVDDTCDGSGACTDNGFVAGGTACGDPTDDECTDPDTCDGAGACVANHEASGAACGDTGVDCLVDDTCDGSGACTDNGFEAPGASCGVGPGMVCDASQNCTPPVSCAALLAAAPGTPSGSYVIDPDGAGGDAPLTVSCDMLTDGGGWTLAFHVFDLGGSPGGLQEAGFDALFGHNLFTQETWNWTSAGGFTAGSGVQLLSTQGAIDSAALEGLWTDIRMTCSLSDSDSTESQFIQIDDYTVTNGNSLLHGSAANGTSYTVPAGSNSFGQTTIWHDNEPTSGNSGHYLCDTWTGGTGAAQFGFCYTDHLNNPNTLDFGDSIVSIAFGTEAGPDGWSVGFTGECGDMGTTAQQNAGTYSIWVR